MKVSQRFDSVWDALEDDPIRVENLKLCAALLIEITETITNRGLTQQRAADVLHITQPRVSALLKGKINAFRFWIAWSIWRIGWACRFP